MSFIYVFFFFFYRLMQLPKFEIELFYSEIVQSILFTAFYQELLPAGIVWTLMCLFVLYFFHKVFFLFNLIKKYFFEIFKIFKIYKFFNKIIKHLLLRKRSVIKVIGGGLSRYMTGLLELAVLITAVNN